MVPIFYFHVRDGDRTVEDPDGAELPDLDAARAKAATAIREAVSRPASAGRDLGRRRFEITDERGRLLATVAFRDVFRLH
jgi:hypothetical protein